MTQAAEDLVAVVAEGGGDANRALSASLAALRKSQRSALGRLLQQEAQLRRVLLELQDLPGDLLAKAEVTSRAHMHELEEAIIARGALVHEPYFLRCQVRAQFSVSQPTAALVQLHSRST